MGSFSLDMSAFAKKAGANADKVVRKVSFSLFSAIMKSTPVDTSRARNSWMFSVNAPDNTAPINIRSNSEADSELINGINGYKEGQELWLSNNLSYIQSLEFGHSKQSPPHAMVRLNVMRFQTFVDKAVLQSKR